ncbi:Pentatricopeptide repeat-containing protein 5, mitochondrial [Exophiala dermatitidis]
MPFKPFAHLARVSVAKGIAHTYAPSVVAAGQSLGQFQNYPVAKFTKTAQLQNAFAGPSGSGAGAKAGYTSQSFSGDAGLAQYYAAWQHAQQTGDDSDWKQHQFARRIGWKHQDKVIPPKHQRLDSRAVGLLRPTPRPQISRVNSERATPVVQEAEENVVETVAVDQAELQLQDVKAPSQLEEPAAREQEVASPVVKSSPVVSTVDETNTELESSSYTQDLSTVPTDVASSASEEVSLSDQIVLLGQQNRYAEIPAVFEAIIKDGHVPTVDAYNHILISAISLSTGYQPWPRALEVYGDMTRRAVKLNATSYSILLQFLAARSLEAYQVQKLVGERASRYGNDGAPVFPSAARQQQLYAADTSLAFATKLYNIARATLPDFRIPNSVYNALVKACAQAGLVDHLNHLLADMGHHGVQLDPRLYTVVIDAQASKQDMHAAQALYEEYRDLAIQRAANDPLDMQVYASLIKAYYSCGLADTGHQFYEKVLQSFKGSVHEQALSEELTNAFLLNGLVAYHVEQRSYSAAISSINEFTLPPMIKDQALSKVCIAAADAGSASEALKSFDAISVSNLKAEPVMALAAMHIRAGDVAQAKSTWNKARPLSIVPSTDFAAMYGLALINAGAVEEGVAEARSMFQRIRAGADSHVSRQMAVSEIDEAILLFGEALSQQQAVVPAPTSVSLLRAMIENGGLVSPVAQQAIASLGPECVHQLNAQDIALALHVQAQMLLSPETVDIAHVARFSHLLETVLNRGILMDPSTVHVVSESLPKVGAARPDLLHRWQQLLHPAPPTSVVNIQPQSPLSPHSVVLEPAAVVDTYDPYGHTTDYRASKAISELVESTSGRIENHLHDGLARLRNVRRAGRNLHYSAYAKLITAAGKAKSPKLVHDILGMAQADVPMSLQIPAVRSGWISILDSMVAACLTVGDREQAAKYHQELLDMGAAPSANTFGIYITTLEGTFDEATEAVKIFQRALSEGVTPSVFLYNAVIGKLGKARRIDDCLRYFGDMEGRGIRPSSVTYGTLVNALCRTSEERFAVDMFDEMEAAPNYRPRPAPYNSIIQYFLNTKRDRSKVLQYYERMKSKNIKPTSHTYKLLIESYATLEPVNFAAAEAILADMKQAGVQPEAVHYGSLIHAKGCVLHDLPAAKAIFDTVLHVEKIRPTDTLYQNLLEAMVANHEVANTPEVLSDMAKRGVSMTPYIANTLIHGWAGEGDIQKAKAIYDQLSMEKREPSTYEAMTRAFLTADDRASASGVVQEMLKKGYPAAVTEKVLALVGGVAA